jgi:hypothetical protein
MEDVEVEGRDSFHPKIPMKRAFFEEGGRMEGEAGDSSKLKLYISLLDAKI